MEQRGGQRREDEPKETPLVGIIMGSDSDLPVMSEAAKVLEELKVPFEIRIISAHRTPDAMYEYAKTARERGLKVIIASAGGAAHLPGMTAALTRLPVIGVPIQSNSLSGVDSLFSIAQMPDGVPVETMRIDGAKNAGLSAAKQLAAYDDELDGRLTEYVRKLEETVKQKDSRLTELGYKDYLDQMEK